jgi:hypothetical protein
MPDISRNGAKVLVSNSKKDDGGKSGHDDAGCGQQPENV